MSKRILKVKARKGSYTSTYAHTGLMFAYCSKITDNEVERLTSFCSCREDLAGCLFYDSHRKIPVDRSRYIVRHVEEGSNTKASEARFNRLTKAGLRIVNIMEARHGWPLTRMIDAESRTDKVQGTYRVQQLTTFRKVLIGSNRWIRSPHMVSLHILLFRLAMHSKFRAIKSYEGLAKACNTCSQKSSGDAYYVAKTFKFWDVIMANFGKMFAGMPTRDNFKKAKYGENYYTEGVSKLCRFKCSNTKINDKFVALAKDAGLE